MNAAGQKEVIIQNETALPPRESLVELASRSLDDSKAEDLVIIDLEGKSSITDHMLIASGRSSRQVSAMAEHLVERLKAAGVKGVSVEGQARGDWVLVDAGDIIIHLFRPEVREFYALEKMWGGESSVQTSGGEDIPRGRVVRIGDADETREMARL